MVDANDIKVGDVVRMSNGAIYTVDETYKSLQYNLESTDGVSLKSLDVEKRLNKYHVGDRVALIKDFHFEGIVTKVEECGYPIVQIAYKIKWDAIDGIFCIFEEDITAMNEEKKVNFEVGDYVKIDSEKSSSDKTLVDCCGYLGIIVGPGYGSDYWKVYFFALKGTYCVKEEYIKKTNYDYEVRVKSKEEYIENDINATKQALNSYYGEYPVFVGSSKALTSLKEMCKRHLESDGAGFKAALNFIYSAANFKSNSLPKIKKVIFNGPATIVLWGDGDKTVVHCGEGDTMDKEKGLAMAICKKALGRSKTHYDYYNVFKKWIKEK